MSIKLRKDPTIHPRLTRADLEDIEKVINSGLIDQVQFKGITAAPSTERIQIGYTYYDSTIKRLRFWDGTQWVNVPGDGSGGGGPTSDLSNYFYLPGRAGGQTGYGGTGTLDQLILIANTGGTTESRFTMDGNSHIKFDVVGGTLVPFDFALGTASGTLTGTAVDIILNATAGGVSSRILHSNTAGGAANGPLWSLTGHASQTGDLINITTKGGLVCKVDFEGHWFIDSSSTGTSMTISSPVVFTSAPSLWGGSRVEFNVHMTSANGAAFEFDDIGAGSSKFFEFVGIDADWQNIIHMSVQIVRGLSDSNAGVSLKVSKSPASQTGDLQQWTDVGTSFNPWLGVSSAGALKFYQGGGSTNALSIVANSSITSHTWTLPGTQGASNTFLMNNGSGTLSWTAVTASIITTPEFVDSSFRVIGSSDATKKLAFEVDGFTTATTRTLTPQNNSYTIAGINIAQTFTKAQTIDTDTDVVSLTLSKTSSEVTNLLEARLDAGLNAYLDPSGTWVAQFLGLWTGGANVVLIAPKTTVSSNRTYSIDNSLTNGDFVVTSGTQTIAGAKTFTGACNFRIDGSTSRCFFSDQSTTSKNMALDISNVSASTLRTLKVTDHSGYILTDVNVVCDDQGVSIYEGNVVVSVTA